jgi:hypothetical protein
VVSKAMRSLVNANDRIVRNNTTECATAGLGCQ